MIKMVPGQQFVFILLALGFVGTTYAQERQTELAPVTIYGNSQELLRAPLTPEKVDREKIKRYQFTDVNRALRHASGVYIREEDGQGLRPNIGMRGTNPDRSKKIVLMEDGILVAPAPYSAPAAYFTPSMNHVSELDIHKGFAGLPYGPNSVGGAINYLTPSIGLKRETELRGSYGSFGTLNTRVSHTSPTEWGGYLIQASRIQSDGFKQIDGGGDTGYEQNHFIGKLNYRASARSSWNLFAGLGTELSNESYLGVAKVDFDENFRRRYSSSALDQMKWNQHRIRLQNVTRVGNESLIETTAYHQKFHRVWYRFDRFADSAISAREVLLDPSRGTFPTYFNILSGSANSSVLGGDTGQLVYARNERSYLSQGIQSKFSTTYSTESVKLKPEFSLRLHRDSIQRHHTADYYNMKDGRLAATSKFDRYTDLEEDSALAVTAVAMENIEWGSWIFTPIVRFENVQFQFSDDLTGRRLSKSDSVWVPGAGILRKLNSYNSVRASANRATTVAGLNRNAGEVREEAMNYELEWRNANPDIQSTFQVTGFYNDYGQITGACTGSNGCSSSQIDIQYKGGRAKVYGVEAMAGKTFRGWDTNWPIQANVTYLVSEFASDFDSTAPEWGLGRIQKGDPLPYIPTWQYTLNFGMARGRWSQDLAFVYQDRVYDQSVADGRQTVSGWGIVDWNAFYQSSSRWRWTAKIDNILDRRYAVAARPFGFRPGKPQAFQVGLVYTF